jgi:hypothetical protein
MKRLEKLNDALYIVRNPYKKYPDMEEAEWAHSVVEVRIIKEIIELLVEKYAEAENKMHFIADLDDIIFDIVTDMAYELRDDELSSALSYGLGKYLEHRFMMKIKHTLRPNA